MPDTVDAETAAKIAERYDGVILPGGQPNASTMQKDERVICIVKSFYAKGKLTAAICAAPCVFEKAGILEGKRATSYPSRGAGTAIDFGLEILRGIGLSEQAETIRTQILYERG